MTNYTINTRRNTIRIALGAIGLSAALFLFSAILYFQSL